MTQTQMSYPTSFPTPFRGFICVSEKINNTVNKLEFLSFLTIPFILRRSGYSSFSRFRTKSLYKSWIYAPLEQWRLKLRSGLLSGRLPFSLNMAPKFCPNLTRWQSFPAAGPNQMLPLFIYMLYEIASGKYFTFLAFCESQPSVAY